MRNFLILVSQEAKLGHLRGRTHFCRAKKWGGAKGYSSPPTLKSGGTIAPLAPPAPTPMFLGQVFIYLFFLDFYLTFVKPKHDDVLLNRIICCVFDILSGQCYLRTFTCHILIETNVVRIYLS